MIAPESHPRVASTFRLQFEPAQDSWMLLHAEGEVHLNASAAEILKLCDGRRSVDQIVAELETAYAGVGLQEDVLDFLGEALEQGWLQ